MELASEDEYILEKLVGRDENFEDKELGVIIDPLFRDCDVSTIVSDLTAELS